VPGTEFVLLDTDVFSYLMKPDPTWALVYRPHVVGKTVALSFITVGELLFGARKRKWSNQKIADLRSRINRTVVLPYDLVLCETYGTLKAKLYASGRPLADNDLWIAACAIRHSVPLVSNNRGHFDRIPDLVLRTERQP
jgi:predicted nucleic acid-binding protein